MSRIILIFIFSFLIFLVFYYFYFIWYSYFYFPGGKNLEVTPPPQPSLGPGSKDYLTNEVEIISLEDSFLLFPKGIDLSEAPIILVLEDPIFLKKIKTKSDFSDNFGLIHLVKKGNIVIFPLYQKSFLEFFNSYLLVEKTNFLVQNSLSEIRLRTPKNNFSKFALIGIGSGAPLATQLLDKNIPQPSVLILISPSETFPLLPASFFGVPFSKIHQLPYNGFLLAIFPENDHFFSEGKVVKVLREAFNKYKFAFKIPSDNYGIPALISNRGAIFRQYSALNYYGTLKITDIVFDCAFKNLNCQLLLDKEILKMGEWSNKREVNKILEIKI